jgi:hypothetical protein
MMRTVRPGATHERRPEEEEKDDDEFEEEEDEDDDDGAEEEIDNAGATSAPYLASKSAFLLKLLVLLPCFDLSRCLPSSSRPPR